MDGFESQSPWLIVQLDSRCFALPAQHVWEMIPDTAASGMPGLPGYARGVINIRGTVLPLIDLRVRFGMASLPDQNAAFLEMMRQRRQDHENWLSELEASVRERRAFHLSSDPTQCKFGRWYASYQSSNIAIHSLLRRFDKPHRQVHATAEHVRELVDQGKPDAALELIEHARTGVLAGMLALFDHLDALVRESLREIAVIVQCGERKAAVTVDEVVIVEALDQASIESLPPALSNPAIRRTARRGNGQTVLLVEPACLLDDAATMAVL